MHKDKYIFFIRVIKKVGSTPKITEWEE